MIIKNIIFLFILFFFSCDNPLTKQEEQSHCTVDNGGFIDDCGICSGGNTGHVANADKDCTGTCFGTAVIDECGVCNGGGYSDYNCANKCYNDIEGDHCDCDGPIEGACDCDGNILDECGVCNGQGPIYVCGCFEQGLACDCDGNVEDCLGICGGAAVVDECGVCNGSGIPKGQCDCDGNVLDECGVCGGEGTEDDGECPCNVAGLQLGCDGNCYTSIDHPDYVGLDECGVCGGSGIPEGECDCSGSLIPESDCDCDGNVLDECDICGGDGVAEGACDCDGTSPIENFDCEGNCLFFLDDCGVCNGPGFNDQGCCGDLVPDCAGICGGLILEDACGVCGGNTLVSSLCGCSGDLTVDCLGECGGTAILDECGVCDGPGEIYECGCTNKAEGTCNCDGTLPVENFDCDGNCIATGDNLTEGLDCAEICGGPGITLEDGLTCCTSGIIDCAGECDGLLTLDECNVCNGPGPETNYDCLGNCAITIDCDGVCGGFAFIDDCGDCVGGDTSDEDDNCGSTPCDSNWQKDLCGICFGNNNTCNSGLLTLATWDLNEMHFYENSDCTGFPFYSFINNVCMEGLCYDFDINFFLDTEEGLRFLQTSSTWQEETEIIVDESTFEGTWLIENSTTLCLDYLDNELEDQCYEIIEFENTYFDCQNNLNSCINNIITFTNIDYNSNLCSKEIYTNSHINTSNYHSNDFFNIDNFPEIFKNIILNAQKINKKNLENNE